MPARYHNGIKCPSKNLGWMRRVFFSIIITIWFGNVAATPFQLRRGIGYKPSLGQKKGYFKEQPKPIKRNVIEPSDVAYLMARVHIYHKQTTGIQFT